MAVPPAATIAPGIVKRRWWRFLEAKTEIKMLLIKAQTTPDMIRPV